MENIKNLARSSGIFYFLFLIFGGGAEIVRNQMIVQGDNIKTMENIFNNILTYRLSIIGDLLGNISYIFLVYFLYKLLHTYHKRAAELMIILVLVGIPIAMVSQAYQFTMCDILGRLSFQEIKSSPATIQAVNFLYLYQNGITTSQLFWGMWLFPYGLLVYKSKFIPKVLGLLLILGSPGFIIDFAVKILKPELIVLTYPGLAITTIAELSMIGYLLYLGFFSKKDPMHSSARNGLEKSKQYMSFLALVVCFSCFQSLKAVNEENITKIQNQKALIIVRSIHHNNTVKIAESMRVVLEADVKLPEDVSIEDFNKYDLIGFGSGIYDQKHHISILQFVENLPVNNNNKKVFIFSTSGVSRRFCIAHDIEDPHDALRNLLVSKGYEVVGEFNCVGYNTNSFLKFFGGINWFRPNKKDLKLAEKFAKSLM